MSRLTHIVIADTADLFLLGVCAVLERQDGYCVTKATSFDDLLSSLGRLTPHIVILSERLDPENDISLVIECILTLTPAARIIVTGKTVEGLLIRDLFASGICGYLYLDDPLVECLPKAVRTVLNNRPYLSPTANAEYLVAMQSPLRDWQLDGETRTVLRMLGQGHPVGQIAHELGVSRRRVYSLRDKLRRRFGALTNEHLISRAAAEGYVFP